MDDSKSVSIIIPVFNAESYLEECLHSVCFQSYPYFEIILIDDGSTDRSSLIASRYASEDSRIRIIRTTNGGVSKARNLGISLAKNPFLCFIDADDFVDPIFLERLTSEIKDAEICVCAKRRWDQLRNRIRCDRFPDFSGTIQSLASRLFPYRKAMRGVTGRLFSASLFRRGALQFDESLSYGEDMKFNCAAFCLAEKAVFCSMPLYTYRIHNPLSLSKKSSVRVSAQYRAQRNCIRSLKQRAKTVVCRPNF